MLAQRKFIVVFEAKWNSDCLDILILSSKPKIEWKNLVLTLMHETERKTLSSRKILTLHKCPFQESKAATISTRLTKISQQEAENRQTLSWRSPFWWSSQADRKVGQGRGGSNMRQRRNLWVDRSKIDSPWRGYYPQQAPGERCH